MFDRLYCSTVYSSMPIKWSEPLLLDVHTDSSVNAHSLYKHTVGQAQLNCPNSKNLTDCGGKIKDLCLLPLPSDKATGEWTVLLNHEWVSVERKNKAATQGMGKQHLQSTVNMGNEQSGLFPLGIYSRGNEKNTREMASHWEIKRCWRILNNTKHKGLVWNECRSKNNKI